MIKLASRLGHDTRPMGGGHADRRGSDYARRFDKHGYIGRPDEADSFPEFSEPADGHLDCVMNCGKHYTSVEVDTVGRADVDGNLICRQDACAVRQGLRQPTRKRK